MIKANQIRAARGFASLDQKKLAELAGLSVASLRRMESDKIGPERSNAGAVENVKRTLEAHGITFLESGGTATGPGVSYTPNSDSQIKP